MPLSFQPACATLAWHSLPLAQVAQALELLQRYTPEVISWPALPQRNFRERLAVRSALGFPGLRLDAEREQISVALNLDDGALDRLGLAYLCDQVQQGSLPNEVAGSLQEIRHRFGTGLRGRAFAGWVMGPVSMSLQLTDEHQRPLVYDTALLDATAQHLALRAAWQSTQLTDLDGDVVICLWEPFLNAFSVPFCPLEWEEGLELIERVFAAVGGCRALASSARFDWALLLESSVELVIFDAFNHSDTVVAAAEYLPGFFERSGSIGWGLIPADEEALSRVTADQIVAFFEDLITRLVSAEMPRERLLEAALITTSDSLEHLLPASAERALALCAEVSHLLRGSWEPTPIVDAQIAIGASG